MGHWKVLGALIKAGANPNSRMFTSDGATPLFAASLEGHVETIRELLRAKADPLLTCMDPELGNTAAVPLDVAATSGYSEVIRELIQQCGTEEVVAVQPEV